MRGFFANCPKGLEYLLRDELMALGATQAHEALAGVHFEGPLAIAYRACLWSRLASRVLLPLAEFDAASDQALYEGVQSIEWAAHLSAESTLAVDATVVQSELRHSQFVAQRVKDAVVDQFRQRDGRRPNVDTDQPNLRIHLRLKRDRAVVSLDLAGQPLHRRGWREVQGEAPLKENLAAAMLLRAQWPEIYAAGGALLDPMCGSGTLLIEAALMAADVAPGLRRAYFGFLGWQQHDSALWEDLMHEAQARAEHGLRQLRSDFYGSDADPTMVQTAKRNAQHAGVAGFLTLERRDIDHLQAPSGVSKGLLITNPPYGERLGDYAEMPVLYRRLGDVLRERFSGWQAAVLAGDKELGRAMRLHADKRYVLFNGALETVLLLFGLRAASDAPAREPKPLSDGALMLKNRLEKNLRHIRKRLQREGISCWRAYDQDLPEYAAAIDIYTQTDDRVWLHIQEYRPPATIDPILAQTRLRELVRVAAEVYQVPRERVALKTRERGKGGSKYAGREQHGEFIEVGEGGQRFLINLHDYLDTGLFLDHRLVRAKIRELATGRRFLNLFAYTASASVYAAAGGALETVSVDLSATYLDWASRNLALNGYVGARHRLIQADAQSYLQQTRERYDLIYVDPPTFSNSKRAEDFDVQRDHFALLLACGERLEHNGLIVFSNNYRQFKLDLASLEAEFEIENWSVPSIPFDFVRRANIHNCWLLRRRQTPRVDDPWRSARIKKSG